MLRLEGKVQSTEKSDEDEDKRIKKGKQNMQDPGTLL
jgi:hypothetical protein